MLFATVHRTRTGSRPRGGVLAVLVAAQLVCPEGLARARSPVAAIAGTRAPASEGTTAVLGLDGSDAAAADALTAALRKAFAGRGFSGKEELSLAEVRLMMGCDDDSSGCLAQAGESMGVERVIYGTLRPAGGDYRLELHVLGVADRIEEAQTSQPLQKAQLAPDRIEQTADEIVNSLFPREIPSTEPEPDVVSEPEPIGTELPPPRVEPSESTYVWGAYKPRPAWKWAGFGIGFGLMAAGGAVAIWTAISLDAGLLRDELRREADKSTSDTDSEGNPNTNNDVPRNSPDLCAKARSQPPDIFENGAWVPQTGRVTNKRVTEVCDKADLHELLNRAGIGVLAAGAVTTIIFTTLLFVHRKDPGVNALLKHNVRLSAAPRYEGGFSLGASFDF